MRETVQPEVTAFYHKPTATISYIVADAQEKRAVIIDPVLDYDGAAGRTATHSVDGLIGYIERKKYVVDWIIDTHVHADHLTALAYVKERIGAPSAIGAATPIVQKHFKDVYGLGDDFDPDGSQFDHLFEDNETFAIGRLQASALATPGHTPACMSYIIGDTVFVGDTLFMPDFGTARCDFPGGSAATLYASIQRLLSLPPETRVFVGHDYAPGGRDPAWETSIARQRGLNIHVGEGATSDAFVSTRESRDATLGMPALIIPSIQVNMRAGTLPQSDADDRAFLKIPLNAF